MREIPININSAQIESFNVILGDEKPEVSTTIALLTDGGKKIAGYSISTNAWNKENCFDLSPVLIPAIRTIMDELERITVEHCKNAQLKLKECL